jgi:transmembrane sensor
MSFLRRLEPTQRPSVEDAAAGWVMREHKGGLTQAELDARRTWLDAAPEHAQAYATAISAMDDVAALAGDSAILALRRQALAARGDTSGPVWLRAAAAALIGLVVLGGVGALMIFAPGAFRETEVRPQLAGTTTSDPASAHETYRTAVGARSSFKLPDGSVATLDTDSVVRVDFTEHERTVRLLKGQALFEVAKHRPTPFRVYAADRCITAVGTQFDVRLDGARLRVTLIEGRVRVSEGDIPQHTAPQANMNLVPGEELDERIGRSMLVTRTDVAKVQSWKDGLVVFEDEPLSQAVAELNRYSPKPIQIGDPSISNLRVTGVFNTDQSDRFAQTLTEIFPLSATYDAATGTVLRRHARP